jgi:hypothetical protein
MKLSEILKARYDFTCHVLKDAHVRAMGRAGLKELAQILPAFPDSVKPIEEPGLAGNIGPREAYEQRNPELDGPTKEMEMGM